MQVNRLACREKPMPTLKHKRICTANISEKMKLRYSFSIERLKAMVGKLGYLLTLATSLGLWFGIYAAISATIPDDRGNYVDASHVDEKINVEELNAFLIDVDESSAVQMN